MTATLKAKPMPSSRRSAADCSPPWKNGVASGEIRADISPASMRQVLLGGVEHAILPYVIFHREVEIENLTREICTMLIDSIRNRD